MAVEIKNLVPLNKHKAEWNNIEPRLAKNNEDEKNDLANKAPVIVIAALSSTRGGIA